MDVYSAELLAELRKEEKRLQKWIRQLIQEKEFAFAHPYQQTLYTLRRQIKTIRQLADADYLEKKAIAREREMLNIYAELLKGEDAGSLQADLDQEALEIERRAAGIPEKPAPRFDAQIIDDALFSLLNGDQQGFHIMLNIRGDVGIVVKKNGDDLLVSLSKGTGESFDQWQQQKLRGLQFVFEEDKQCCTQRMPAEKIRDALALKTLIARILYEIFPGENSREGTIRFF
ncbi:MAG: hypothetical protein INR69_13975 [Mucilaginibacter polytrichastri]|nr:hypothetical protein [Mucilaginibacter polytrichastri]